MPDPIEPINNETPSNVAPNLDAELDAALNRSFANIVGNKENPAPPPEEKSNPPGDSVDTEKPKQDPVSKEPVKPEVKIETKPEAKSEPQKPLPHPDSIGDDPTGKTSKLGKEGWNALKNNYRTAHQMAEKLESENVKLKKTIADSKENSQKELEAIRKEKAELEKYRAMVDIQADPEFKTSYEAPLTKAKDAVLDVLKKMGVKDEFLSQIDYENTEMLDRIVAVVQQTDRFSASKLERNLKEILDLQEKRREALDNHGKTFRETLEKKEKEIFQKQAESEGRIVKHVESKLNEKNEKGMPTLAFLHKIDPREDAPQGEIDQINAHNAMVDDLRGKLDGLMKAKEPEQIAEMALAAIYAHYLMREFKSQKQRADNAEAELKKISVVNSETPARKAASIKRSTAEDPIDTDTALRNHFAR